MKYINLFLFSIILDGCVFNCNDYLSNEIKPLKINGIVRSKNKSTTGCFGDITLFQDNSIYVLKNVCYCVAKEEKLWNYVLEGDSIYKESGKLIVEVWRGGQKSEFTYPCCSR